MVSLLVVEDDPFNREGTRLYLEQQGFEILEAGDAQSGWEVATCLLPEVALLDIVIPRTADRPKEHHKGEGLVLARRLKARWPQMGIVLLSAYEDRGDEVEEMLRAGTRGLAYKLKGCHPAALLQAIIEVQQGKVIIDAGVVSRRLNVQETQSWLTPEERPWVEQALASLHSLTPRERQVATRIAASHNTLGIAASLGISAKTVENHIGTLYDKLHLNQMHEEAPHLRAILVLAKVLLLADGLGQ